MVFSILVVEKTTSQLAFTQTNLYYPFLRNTFDKYFVLRTFIQ